MQLLMWQPVIVGIAHFLMDCSDLFGAPLMLSMMVIWTHIPFHQPWRLDGYSY